MAKPYPDKPVTIRFTKRAYEKTRAYLFRDERESVSFLFAHVQETRERRIFLVDYVATLHDDCYRKRTRTSVVVHHRAKNEVYRRFVESPYNGFINAHSHPFSTSSVAFSTIDDADDLREVAWGYAQLPRGKRSCRQKTKVHLLSMVFGQKSLAARGYKPGNPQTLPAIEQVQVLDEKFQIICPSGAASPCLTPQALSTLNRHILAFGEEGHQVLASLRIVLVGAGGIGSILAEGLTRLGVMHLTLIDGDSLEYSNLNRWQGGRPKDIGKLKAHVLARRLRTMNPQMKVRSIGFPLTHPKSLAAIKGADVLIGAVDNHQARFLMNRISAQYLIPYLDAATVIKKDLLRRICG
ncbi:MAG: ThiF family adenylyltransferase [Nitrososphaera sp.]